MAFAPSGGAFERSGASNLCVLRSRNWNPDLPLAPRLSPTNALLLAMSITTSQFVHCPPEKLTVPDPELDKMLVRLSVLAAELWKIVYTEVSLPVQTVSNVLEFEAHEFTGPVFIVLINDGVGSTCTTATFGVGVGELQLLFGT